MKINITIVPSDYELIEWVHWSTNTIKLSEFINDPIEPIKSVGYVTNHQFIASTWEEL